MYGDPDLKPEVSRNIELTAEYKPISRLAFEFSLYRSQATNLIDYKYINANLDEDPIYQYLNYKKSRIDGFDTSMLYNISNQWKIGMQLHLLRAKEFDEKDGDYDLTIDSKVPSSGSLMLMYDGKKLQGTWFTRYYHGHGDRDQQTRVDSVSISDLALSYKCTDDIAIRFGVQNVFDRDYALNAGYPMPGINYRLEMEYSF
jgi:outer membrane receptor for ferrienterochelin and colicins